MCHISLSIPRRLANKRSHLQLTSLTQIHSSKGTKSGFHTKSKEVRFDTNTTIHLYRYGISNSTENSQSSSEPSKSSYSDHQNNSFSDSSFGMNFPFSFGQTQSSSRLYPSRQTANVPIIGHILPVDHQVMISSMIKFHFKWWMNTNRFVQGMPIHPPDSKTFLYTNASHYGWGAHLEPMSLSFHGRWSEDQSQLHISMLEIMAIRFALIKALKYIHHSCVMISTNNTSVVSYINKQGGTYSPNLCVEVWKILQWCLKHRIVIRIRHIPANGRQLIENRQNSQNRVGIASVNNKFNFYKCSTIPIWIYLRHVSITNFHFMYPQFWTIKPLRLTHFP